MFRGFQPPVARVAALSQVSQDRHPRWVAFLLAIPQYLVDPQSFHEGQDEVSLEDEWWLRGLLRG